MTDYLAKARELHAVKRAAAEEAAIQDLASHLREADERADRHAALRQKHGLHPAASPREIADAEIAHERAFGSFVVSRYGGRAEGAQVLCPESAPEHLRDYFQKRRDRLLKEFSEAYAGQAATRLAESRRAA